MITILLIFLVTALVVCTYVYFCIKSKGESYENSLDTGIIYLIDGDIDKKFTLKELILPTFAAFEKPFKTCADIKKVPADIPIKLIISTKGGDLQNCEKILKTLKHHKAGYIAYICGECYSAGAILALGAKEIVMGRLSFIGKMDPQIYENNKHITVINYYDLDEKYIDSHNIGIVKESQNTINYMNELFEIILKDHPSYKLLNKIKEQFVFSKLPHCKLFDFDQCSEMGLHVRRPNEEELAFVTLLDDL